MSPKTKLSNVKLTAIKAEIMKRFQERCDIGGITASDVRKVVEG